MLRELAIDMCVSAIDIAIPVFQLKNRSPCRTRRRTDKVLSALVDIRRYP